jgi:hypothetical protein
MSLQTNLGHPYYARNFGKRIWALDHYAKDDMRVPSILELGLSPRYKVKGIDNNASPTLNCLKIFKISHA